MLDIDEILNLENINDYFWALSSNDRIVFLKNTNIRDYYLKEHNLDDFIALLYMLLDNEILTLFDNDMCNKLISGKCNKVIISLLKSFYPNKNLDKIFENEKMIDFLIQDFSTKHLICNLNESITEIIFNRIILQKKVEVLKYLNEETFLNLIKKEDIVNKIKIIDRDNILLCLPIKVLNELLIDTYFKSKLLKMSIEDIYYLTNNGLIIPNNLIYEEDLICKYINITSAPARRIYINSLINNNYSLYEVINERLKNFYDEKVFDDLINEYNIVTRRSDSTNLKEQISSIYSDKCLQILIDRYFEDFEGNVLTNIYSVLNFNKKYNIISKENIEYYNLIIHFSKFDIDGQKQIYNIMPKNVATSLYEDFRFCQNKAYNLINQEIVDVSKLKVSNVSGVSVYELDGEKFVLPVHAMRKNRNEYVYWDKNAYKTLCLTLIGNENLGTYRNPEEYLIVGFKELDINSIMHIYHSDSFTDKEKSTSRVNEIYGPHELLLNTIGYNEILVTQRSSKNKLLTPDYVVCYDIVTENDIRCARNLGNISIIKINTKNYKIDTRPFDYEENNYVRDINDLYSYKYRKLK